MDQPSETASYPPDQSSRDSTATNTNGNKTLSPDPSLLAEEENLSFPIWETLLHLLCFMAPCNICITSNQHLNVQVPYITGVIK